MDPSSWCSLAALLPVLDAQYHGANPAAQINLTELNTDSRTLTPGALFVALRGQNYAGHKFVQQAMERGAAAAVIDSEAWQALQQQPPALPLLVVADTMQALAQIAAWWRKQHGGKVIGVTGSNGKTTTKELLAAGLASIGPIHKTFGNLNNLIGLPLTLCRWRQQQPIVIAEMGMNRPGEIAQMAQIAQPEVGLVTCVAAAHLGGPGLGSLQAIAQAKTEMYANLPEDGICVLNQDDQLLRQTAAQVIGKRRVVTFGMANDADVQLLQVQQQPKQLRATLRIEGKLIEAEVPLLGLHNGMNVAATFAVACLSLGIDPAQVAQAITQVQLPSARLQWRTSSRLDLAILDDSYNANPGSMEAACRTLMNLAGKRRSVVILGDMLELGPQAMALHQDLGKIAGQLGVQVVLAVGEFAPALWQGAKAAGAKGKAYADHQALLPELWSWLEPMDMVLVKGSRGSHMETIVDWLSLGVKS